MSSLGPIIFYVPLIPLICYEKKSSKIDRGLQRIINACILPNQSDIVLCLTGRDTLDSLLLVDLTFQKAF